MHCLTYDLVSLCLTARNLGENLQGSKGKCIFADFIERVLNAASLMRLWEGIFMTEQLPNNC